MKGTVPETQTSMIAYAVSENGIDWLLPELGIIEYEGSRANNYLLNEHCQIIRGYEFENCLPIDNDEVRSCVRWSGRLGIANLKGQKVIVLIRMNAGTIYSISI